MASNLCINFFCMTEQNIYFKNFLKHMENVFQEPFKSVLLELKTQTMPKDFLCFFEIVLHGHLLLESMMLKDQNIYLLLVI